MGQRLNIEITDNGNVLANAYYHWSGYTDSAIYLTSEIIKQMKFTQFIQDKGVKAIALLEHTGAGMNEEEMKKAKELYNRPFNPASDRNGGLISVSPEGIEDTRRWEEARVTIDLTAERVDFEAIVRMSEEEYVDEWEGKLEGVETIDIDIHEMRYSELDTLAELIKNNPTFKITSESDFIYTIIE